MAPKIGFCGSGNMGKAIMKGLIASNMARGEDLLVYDVYSPAAENAAKETGATVVLSEAEIAARSDILVLAVKPDTIPEVLSKIKGSIAGEKLVISIAAGVTLERLEAGLNPGAKVVRVMPNTPAMVLEGMAAVLPNAHCNAADTKVVLDIFNSIGKAEQVTEKIMDAVLGVSGSAPAFVYMLIEAMADGAVYLGMPRKMAYKFAAQTVYGSAKMVLESGLHPGALKDMVCSPAGTTIEGVKTLEDTGFRSSVMNAVVDAGEKNRKL